MPSSHSWTYFWNRARPPPKKSVLPCTHMIIRPELLENHHLPIILSVIQEHTLPKIAGLTVCCTSRGLTFIFNSYSVSSKCQNFIYSYPQLLGQPLYQSRMGVREHYGGSSRVFPHAARWEAGRRLTWASSQRICQAFPVALHGSSFTLLQMGKRSQLLQLNFQRYSLLQQVLHKKKVKKNTKLMLSKLLGHGHHLGLYC